MFMVLIFNEINADMQLISKYKKGIMLLLCVMDLFTKYDWVVTVKDNKGVTIVNAFQSILDSLKKESNKIWVDRGSELYNSSFKRWLKENDIKTYSINDIVGKYNNTYHTNTTMKPIDVNSNYYAEYNVDSNKKEPKFKIGDDVKISRNTSIFAKENTPNWSEELFVISKIKNIVPWFYFINDLNGEEIIGTFYEKELQKTNQEEFRIEKVIKRR